MKEITREKLNKILEEHEHWTNEDCENWEEMKADLSNAELCYADLCNADLCCADLNNADLYYADLRSANFRGANLRDADLRGANLRDADLRGTDFRGANLRGADLRDANLRGAYLLNADLMGADLSEANLRSAYLLNADLMGADLRGANLRNADLSGTKNVPYVPMVCPEKGDFIGWKKADGNKNKVIVKLHIPSDAKRSSATTRKCRCSKAEVIAIYNLDGTEAGETTCHSDYDKNFIYEIGKTVEVTDFSENRWNECAKGIHFFISRQEAIDY